MSKHLKSSRSDTSSAVNAELSEVIRSRVGRLVDKAEKGDPRASSDLRRLVKEIETLCNASAAMRPALFSPLNRFKVETVAMRFAAARSVKGLSAEIIAEACEAVAGSSRARDFIERDSRPFEALRKLLRPPTSKLVAQAKVNRHTPSEVDEQLTPRRAQLAKTVKALSESLLRNPADATWLLETLPRECRSIASSLDDYSKLELLLAELSAEQFGTRLRKLREACGLTQQQLAERASTYSQNISEHERGVRTPQVETIRAYAAAMDVMPELLLQK